MCNSSNFDGAQNHVWVGSFYCIQPIDFWISWVVIYILFVYIWWECEIMYGFFSSCIVVRSLDIFGYMFIFFFMMYSCNWNYFMYVYIYIYIYIWWECEIMCGFFSSWMVVRFFWIYLDTCLYYIFFMMYSCNCWGYKKLIFEFGNRCNVDIYQT